MLIYMYDPSHGHPVLLDTNKNPYEGYEQWMCCIPEWSFAIPAHIEEDLKLFATYDYYGTHLGMAVAESCYLGEYHQGFWMLYDDYESAKQNFVEKVLANYLARDTRVHFLGSQARRSRDDYASMLAKQAISWVNPFSEDRDMCLHESIIFVLDIARRSIDISWEKYTHGTNTDPVEYDSDTETREQKKKSKLVQML
jgi:hypothetical protein